MGGSVGICEGARSTTAPPKQGRKNATEGPDASRLENWNRFRAPGLPYFLRSTARASRVRNPAFFSGGRYSGLSLVSARLIPCRMAPACPDSPPPQTITAMSTLLSCSTTSSGRLRIILLVSRPKYSSRVRSLTTNSPQPGFIRTRAIDSLRRPVAETIRSLAISLESSCVRRFHGDGLLGGVGVLVARVDLQLLHQRAAEGGARQHAADGVLDEAGRLAPPGPLRRGLDEAAPVQADRKRAPLE